MKLVFIGPDGAGKTTTAEKAAVYYDMVYLKFSQSKDVEEVVEVTRDVIFNPNYTDCVLDRIKPIDHLIYGRIIDNLTFTVEELQDMNTVMRGLERSTNKLLIIYMYSDVETLWARLNERGDETYIKKEHLQQIMDAYTFMFAHRNDVMWVDTTGKTPNEVFDYVVERIDQLENSIHTPA